MIITFLSINGLLFVFFCPRNSERDGLCTHLTVSFKAFSVFTFLKIWAQNFSFWMKAFLLAHPFRNIWRRILHSVNHYHRHPVWLSWPKQTKRSGEGRKTRKTRNDRRPRLQTQASKMLEMDRCHWCQRSTQMIAISRNRTERPHTSSYSLMMLT